MKAPIIVSEAGSIDIFESREQAESYLEPIDVKNNEYEVYDSTGKLVEQRIATDEYGNERVLLEDPATPTFGVDKLTTLLRSFLKLIRSTGKAHETSDLTELNLADLIKESSKYKSS